MRYLIFCILILGSSACQKDNDIDPISGDTALHYDGPNQSAPEILRGLSYAAVRFPADEITRLQAQGKRLIGVDYYVQDRPEGIRLLILDWNPQSENEPGNVLYERSISRSDIDGNTWNRHSISSAVIIPAEGFWVACEVDAGDEDLRVIGCDPGPRHPEGDVYGIFGDNLPGWTSLYDFSNNSVDVNWNIRAQVE